MKKLISLILVISIVLSYGSIASAFNDTGSHWANGEIEALFNRGIIKGYPDGSFRPDDNVSRAEFLSMTYRVINANLPVFQQFKDVKHTDWYYDGITQAKAMGIAPYLGEYAYPNKPITREEASISLSLLYGLRPNLSTPFSDMASITDREKVGALYQEGIIKGYPDGSFRPQGLITRAEFSSMFNKLLVSKGNPTETYPYARVNVDKSPLITLKDMAGVSEASKETAKELLEDSYATRTQVSNHITKMEEEIAEYQSMADKKKAEESKKETSGLARDVRLDLEKPTLPMPSFAPIYPVYVNPKAELSEVITNLEANLNNVKNPKLQRYIVKALDNAKKVLDNNFSTPETLIVEKNQLLKFNEIITTNGTAFFLGDELMDYMGKELTLQMGRVYKEEYLRSLVTAHNINEEVTNRLVISSEPNIIGDIVNTDFTVYYTDPVTYTHGVIFFAEHDTTPPVLRFPGVIDVAEGSEVNLALLLEKGVEAYDTKDGNISDKIVGSVNGRPLPLSLSEGRYILELTVRDNAGNMARKEMELVVYGMKKSDLTLKLLVDDRTSYENGKIGTDGNPYIEIEKRDLGKPLPNFANILIKENGEVLIKSDGKYLAEIEWYLDGNKISDLSSYEAGKHLTAKVLSPLKTSSDPVREFSNIEIEVKVLIINVLSVIEIK